MSLNLRAREYDEISNDSQREKGIHALSDGANEDTAEVGSSSYNGSYEAAILTACDEADDVYPPRMLD